MHDRFSIYGHFVLDDSVEIWAFQKQISDYS